MRSSSGENCPRRPAQPVREPPWRWPPRRGGGGLAAASALGASPPGAPPAAQKMWECMLRRWCRPLRVETRRKSRRDSRLVEHGAVLRFCANTSPKTSRTRTCAILSGTQAATMRPAAPTHHCRWQPPSALLSWPHHPQRARPPRARVSAAFGTTNVNILLAMLRRMSSENTAPQSDWARVPPCTPSSATIDKPRPLCYPECVEHRCSQGPTCACGQGRRWHSQARRTNPAGPGRKRP